MNSATINADPVLIESAASIAIDSNLNWVQALDTAFHQMDGCPPTQLLAATTAFVADARETLIRALHLPKDRTGTREAAPLVLGYAAYLACKEAAHA